MKNKSNKVNNNNVTSASGIADDDDDDEKIKMNKSNVGKFFPKMFKSAANSVQAVPYVSINNTNSDTLRVLTYNLWCHRIVGGRHSARRLNTFAAWLLDNSTQFYDIICLQEVFVCNPLLLLNYGSGQRTNLIETVKSKYPYSYTANAPWFGVQDSGCLILSAHNIEPCHQESFSDFNLPQLATHKGYMCCKITIANRDLIVINTHLNAAMQTSVVIRARQLEQINNHITTCHADQRVILCGDLNIEYGSKEYNDMLKYLSINRLVDSTHNATATYARLVRLDYILINQYFSPMGSAVVSADETNQDNRRLMVSDHEGLEVTLKFTSIEPLNAQITIVPQPNKVRARQIKRLVAYLVPMLGAIIYYYFFQS